LKQLSASSAAGSAGSKQFVKLTAKNVLTHVAVGMGAASFWRGAWYILDDHLFPDDAAKSASASLALGTLGMAASQGLIHKVEILASKVQKQQLSKDVSSRSLQLLLKVARFGVLYTIAVSCVLVWRGTWVGWDVLYEYTHPNNKCEKTGKQLQRISSMDRGHASMSGLLSHSLAVSILVGTGVFASVLAPPAASGVIKDFTIKAGLSFYSAPAQKIWNSLTSSGSNNKLATVSYSTKSSSIVQSSAAKSNIVARANNNQTAQPPKMNTGLSNTTRIATSIHKY
jgi:hypothetical protein